MRFRRVGTRFLEGHGGAKQERKVILVLWLYVHPIGRTRHELLQELGLAGASPEFTGADTGTVVSSFTGAGWSSSASGCKSLIEWSSQRSTPLPVRITGIRS